MTDTQKITLKDLLKILSVFLILYLFLCSISMMGASFKMFGKGFAKGLFRATSNPILALFLGILATSIVQSSSTTTSIIVGMVSSGTLNVAQAVPMVMGANIGTTVTATIVSLGQITRREEFRRGYSGAMVHDLFNLFCVIILLPMELCTGYLQKAAAFLATYFYQMGGLKVTSPVKAAVKPVVHAVKGLMLGLFPNSTKVAGCLLLIIATALTFLSLYLLVRNMKSLVISRIEHVIDRYICRHGVYAILFGMVFTTFVQSSSITTSLLVPMLGAGIITLENAFPITMGANLGTTTTALLASMTGNISALTIALVHALFNLTGVLIFFPFKTIRHIPIRIAKFMSSLFARKRYLAFVYVITVFFLLPMLLIYLLD